MIRTAIIIRTCRRQTCRGCWMRGIRRGWHSPLANKLLSPQSHRRTRGRFPCLWAGLLLSCIQFLEHCVCGGNADC